MNVTVKTKRKLFAIYRILILVVGAGIVLTLFIGKPNEGLNRIVLGAMCILIGIAWVVMGIVWDRVVIKLTALLSGVFLIVVAFLPPNDVLQFISLICILLPILLVRFSKDEEVNKQ